MDFRTYLKNRRLSPQTIESYHRYLKKFFTYLKESGQEAESMSYADLLGYVKYCRKQGLKPPYINQLLGVVRHYYNYLKAIKKISDNPASGLFLRGRPRRIPHDLLTAEQLDAIYTSYERKGLAGKRNKIILGLLIYQGLSTHELERLEAVHLRLREGKIEIPGSRKSHRRILKLEAHQMIDLQEYVSSIREHILAYSGKTSEKLLVSLGESDYIRSSLDKLMHHLRKRYAYITNAAQLRQSRIAIWTKQYDIRHAQYLSGHKYVSSTERYESTDMKDLQKELEKHHPSRK